MIDTTWQIDYRLGGVPRYNIVKKGQALMLVPDEVRRCVVFICYNSGYSTEVAGTAFFVGIPYRDLGINFIYLITAKHVIEDVRQNSIDQLALIRVNVRGEPVQFVGAHVDAWFSHPEDNTADIAVIRWLPHPKAEDIDFLNIPIDTLATEETIRREGVGVGDEVFITGLFTKHYGEKKNIPIVRIGNIALMPEEKILTRYGQADAYLIEARSIGGLSGSPVFVNLSGARELDGKVHVRTNVIYLIGLIHGHWPLTKSEFVKDRLAGDEPLNTGIAVVVPVSKILETLNREELVEERERGKEEERKKKMPMPDSEKNEITEEEFKEKLRKVSRPKKARPDEEKSET